MGLMQQRFSWEDEKLQMRVFAVEDLAEGSDAREEFQQVCRECDMLVAVSMRSEASRALLDIALSTPRKVDLIMDSSQVLLPASSSDSAICSCARHGAAVLN